MQLRFGYQKEEEANKQTAEELNMKQNINTLLRDLDGNNQSMIIKFLIFIYEYNEVADPDNEVADPTKTMTRANWTLSFTNSFLIAANFLQAMRF